MAIHLIEPQGGACWSGDWQLLCGNGVKEFPWMIENEQFLREGENESGVRFFSPTRFFLNFRFKADGRLRRQPN
jgi:hypothetical protein